MQPRVHLLADSCRVSALFLGIHGGVFVLSTDVDCFGIPTGPRKSRNPVNYVVVSLSFCRKNLFVVISGEEVNVPLGNSARRAN